MYAFIATKANNASNSNFAAVAISAENANTAEFATNANTALIANSAPDYTPLSTFNQTLGDLASIIHGI